MSYFPNLAQAIRSETPVAVATRLDGVAIGAKLVILENGHTGDLGTTGLNDAVVSEARALLSAAHSTIRTFGLNGEPTGSQARVFIQTFVPKPDMYVFGAIDFSRAMASIGKFLGYRVTVIDARPIFATKTRIPDADEIVVAWPDEFLTSARVTASTVLVVLTHDVKFDVPLLRVALTTEASYIGVMGSRRTHATRVAALRAAGIDDEQLSRLSAPVGLNIGACTPEETAISIAAEIVALRRHRSGGRLRDTTLPVHGISDASTSTAPVATDHGSLVATGNSIGHGEP